MSNVNKIGIFISIVLLLNNLARDWDLEQQNVGDLRNRIVGARMQKDGLSPYFHKWKNGDGVRYYDPLNENNLKVSTCTASPFFHTLLYPLAELSYDVTCKIWIMILYVLLVLMMIMAIVLSANRNVLLICFIGVGYTFSETWLDTVVTKQMYLFIPFFAMLVYLFLVKGDNKPFLYILAGIFFICLVLTKPTALLFLLPLIFIQHKYKLSAKIKFMTPVVLALFITLSSSQFNLWQDYLKNSEEQVKKHQQLNPGVQENDKANFSEVEGVSLLRPDESFNQMYKPFVEHANFFVMIHLLFNYKIPVDLLFLLFCVSLLAVVFIFFYFQKYRSSKYSLENYILIGFCLYMLSDLFSPVYRGQYNTIQWIFPLFLVPITFQKKYGWLYFCIFLAFVLNIHYKPFILMQHTLGEYIWLSSFLIYAFLFERNHADISTNVSLSGAMK